MSRILYDCKLTGIRNLTPTMRELSIQFIQPKGFKFQAGQFIMMQVPDPGKSRPTQRAYSVASSDRTPENIRLVIKVYEQGLASNFVRTLKGGEEIKISGPFGRHFFHQPVPSKVNFVCTGAGISQHMSYLQSHPQLMKNSRVKMLLGVWNESEIFYQNELAEVKKNIPSFECDYVLDKADPTWKGKVGYVTQYFDDLELDEQSIVYLCGNPNMIKSAKEMLASKYKFPPEKIIAEAFN